MHQQDDDHRSRASRRSRRGRLLEVCRVHARRAGNNALVINTTERRAFSTRPNRQKTHCGIPSAPRRLSYPLAPA